MSIAALNRTAKIYIPGHTGLVGSALFRRLKQVGFENLQTASSSSVDLRRQEQVESLFEELKPEYLFICAAKVGGILANANYPADFIYQNLMIQTNLIEQARIHGVKRVIFLGSSCIYPKFAKQPINESSLLSAPLEPTNQAYAIAKIAGLEMIRSYNQQYGTQFLGVMPTNLYGQGDNYDLQNSHVLPALIRKMHEAKFEGKKEITLWGTGEVRREFLFSEDLSSALLFLMELDDESFGQLIKEGSFPLVNVGVGEDITIKELASLIQETVGFEGKIHWDSSYPDGTPQKLLDVSKIRGLGWRAKCSLSEGIAQTYEDYRCRLPRSQ